MNLDRRKDKLPLVAIVMGSRSDWQTMKAAADILDEFDIGYEKKIVSAHRTPELLREFGLSAAAKGLRVIIAGAGGAAHLPGMMASYTRLPVLGVPVESKVLRGVDSLLSIVQMPFGIPVGCLAIGESGAKNAALLAVAILALEDKELAKKLELFRVEQTRKVLDETL
ncbi:5-(carboxyamino)imidazole ribonucleotide mutase [Methylacidiphilum caldifontis]|uniref:N5-carboxyaminoimidazole ribonucleotide mutase n=1 Tax=Methylacidiphilum caldifontis TaxID=2795386 RepID=A0A4Y8PAG9_9BACT|nr:5-(carboxyamino)imidazole ribonucleotide mutase [Methylacidiphilum caldifontis]TFE67579.1 5-(carboxyamino)imidazole ribonucleotide mutase [Methylacidiphilum caldifontis]